MHATHGTESAGNGARIGPYETLAALGKTESGGTFLARDTRTGNRVVVKTLDTIDVGSNPAKQELGRRFRRETEACACLSHDAILRVLEAGQADGRCWASYQYFDGHSAADHVLPYQLLPVHQVLALVASVAEGLDHAHRRDVIHRNIKPGNLLVDAARRQVKIMDFGFSKVVDTHVSRTGLVLGTPSYKSPEQLAAGDVTGASDLFSLGVTLYQLLTGRLPFEAESMVGLMQSIVQQPHETASRARPGLSADLDAVIDRALEKHPGDRYAHCGDMAAALRNVAGALAA